MEIWGGQTVRRQTWTRRAFLILSDRAMISHARGGDSPGPSGAGDGYLANVNYAPGFDKITI
jgi:hypothetical protein